MAEMGPQIRGVSLGPYKLVRWDSGVQIEFERFDDYWRGRPRSTG